MRLCSTPSCKKKHYGLGYCQNHYRNFRLYGNPLTTRQVQNHLGIEVCTIKNCGFKHLAKGLCIKHYNRQRKTGDANTYSGRETNTHRIIDDKKSEIDLRDKKGRIVGIAKVPTNRLQELLQYNWCIDTSGYAIARINNKLVRMHRYLLVTDSPMIDHKDRDRLNNLTDNIRPCLPLDNARNNGGVHKTSVYRGVSLFKTHKTPRWAVYASFPDKTTKRFWGYFDTELEAALRYNEVAKKYGNEFTYINTIP